MFELREALIRQILFAMENQNVRYLIDAQKGVLVREELVSPEERPDDQTDPTARYHDLPPWKSADGFFLMERFLTEIHEPVMRDRLQTILLSGNRVFRRFKDTIRESPEIQRRYYRFKYLAMRDVVVEWYNSLRELAGLDIVELGADEELEDVLQSEISIGKLEKVPGALISELDRQAFYEAHVDSPEALVDYVYKTRYRRLPDPASSTSVVFGARTSDDDLIGFLWMVHEVIDTGSSLYTVHQVFVSEEFRGLGIATELLRAARHYVAGKTDALFLWRAVADGPAVAALARTVGLAPFETAYRPAER